MAAPLSAITAIVRDILGDNAIELASNTRFEDLAGWDSMDLVSVVVEAECRFDLQFEPVEIDQLTTVADLMHMIKAKQVLASA